MLKAQDIELISELSGVSGECTSVNEFADAVLSPMVDLFASNSSLFYTFDQRPQAITLQNCYAHNLDMLYCNLYQSNYYKHDPCYNLFSELSEKNTFASISTDQAIGHEHHYINSAYYEDFLHPQKIHNSLIFSVADKRNYYGLFGFHRPKNKEVYTQADHLKARLLAAQFAGSLRSLEQLEKQEKQENTLAFIMKRTSVLGYITVNKHGIIEAVSDNIRSNIPKLGQCAPDNYWPFIKSQLSEKALQFVNTALNEHAGNCETEFNICDHKTLPTMSLVSHNNGKLLVLFQNESAADHISQGKLDQYNLTHRQRDVVFFISRGLANTQIASEMGVSIKTLESHLTTIYQKTGCHNKTSLLSALRL